MIVTLKKVMKAPQYIILDLFQVKYSQMFPSYASGTLFYQINIIFLLHQFYQVPILLKKLPIGTLPQLVKQYSSFQFSNYYNSH